MKKKRILTLMGSICLTLALVALLLPACAKEEVPVTPTPARPTPVAPTPAPTPAAPAEFEWPSSLKVTTTGVGSSTYAKWCGVMPIMEKSLGIKARIIPEGTDALKPIRLLNKECDFVDQAATCVAEAIEGVGANSDQQRLQLRLIWFGQSANWGYIVRGDSKIKTIYDIKKGTRMVDFTPAPSWYGHVISLIEGVGLILGEDVVIVPIGGYADVYRAVVDGRADITFASTSAAGMYEADANPRGVRWLDLPFEDKQLWEAIVKYSPTCSPTVMSQGVKSAWGHKGIGTAFLIYALAETDQELVYHLAKWFDENYDSFKDVEAMAATMSPDNFRDYLDSCPFPIAEGTTRYLKETGRWTAEDDEWNEAAIKLNTKYVDAWQAAVAEAKAKGIAVDCMNEEWMNLWNNAKKDFPRYKVRL